MPKVHPAANDRTPDTRPRRERIAHPTWKIRQLGSEAGRNGIPGLTVTQAHIITCICARADDRTGETTTPIDDLARAANVSRSTIYRNLAALEAIGILLYRPGQITRGRGYASRFRIVKTRLVALIVEARNLGRAAGELRREATTLTAAQLGTVHRTLIQRVRDARYKTSHHGTHTGPTGRLTPTGRPPHRPTTDPYGLSCLICELPATHPCHSPPFL